MKLIFMLMVIIISYSFSFSSPIYSLLCMDANIWASGDDDGVVKGVHC